MLVKKTVERIMQLYRRQGQEKYGEEVNQLEHALQAADLARADSQDDEVVAAAFLHDIGHLLEHDAQESMGQYGAKAHDRLGAEFLHELGFSSRVVKLVDCHVQAKRYLCAIDPGYFEALSDASKASLQWQGGPMDLREVSDFSSRQDLNDILALRRYDDEAKVNGRGTDDIETIEALLISLLQARLAVA